MDARTKARLKKLTKAIENACARRVEEATPLKMVVNVTTGFRLARLVGRHNNQTHVSVRTRTQAMVEVLGSYRIGRNPGDDFFELKLVPELGSVVALWEDAEETIFTQIEPIDIIKLFAPKDVQRIIRLIDAI